MKTFAQAALFPTEAPLDPTLPDLLPFYRDHLIASKKSHHTVASYLRILRSFVRDAGAGRRLNAYSVRTIEAYIARVRYGDGADKTVELNAAALRHFFRWARENEFMREDPGQRLIFPRAQIKLPEIPSIKEVDKLLETAAVDPHDLLLLLLFAEGGLKREEVLALLPKHVNVRHPLHVEITVPASSPRKVRVARIPRDYAVVIEAILEEAHPEIPVCTFSPPSVSARVEAMGRLAGVRPRITPASLRHFCAVRILKAGRTIDEVHAYLGLASPKDSPIMRDIYVTLAKLPL
ncbi:MAG: site-specific integrase [Nitrospirae bacterium]|nr:site-specific integrase [Nitrospirota bacterium]